MCHPRASALHLLLTTLLLLPVNVLLSSCTYVPTEEEPVERLSGVFEVHLLKAQPGGGENVYFKAIVDFDSLTWREIDKKRPERISAAGAVLGAVADRPHPLSYELSGEALHLELWVDREEGGYLIPALRVRTTCTVDGRFRKREGRDLFGPFRGLGVMTQRTLSGEALGAPDRQETSEWFRGEAVGYCISGGSQVGRLRVYRGH